MFVVVFRVGVGIFIVFVVWFFFSIVDSGYWVLRIGCLCVLGLGWFLLGFVFVLEIICLVGSGLVCLGL